MIEWNDTYSVKIKEIDNQHKKLFNLFNSLHSAMKEGKGREAVGNILQGLIDYTVAHFGAEERIMSANAYPGYSEHLKAHKDLISQVTAFNNKFKEGNAMVTLELMNFLKNWLSKHILETDKQYSPFLNSKGVV